MKVRFAERTKVLPSPIREIFDKIPHINLERIHQLKLGPVIDLSVGQPHISINPAALAGIKQLLETKGSERSFGYSPVAGRPETLKSIVDLYKNYYPNVEYQTQEVMCTNGANQALWNALSIFIQEKHSQRDIVLAYEPYFGHYNSQVAALGGNLIKIPTENTGFRPFALNLKRTLEQYPQAKVLILNFPANPSGVTLDKEEIQAINKILSVYKNIVLIIDDVYRDISFKQHISPIDIDPSLKDRSIVINSGSKGLVGAPDMRIGMVGAPREWIVAMCQQQMLVTAGVSYLSQVALISAINKKVQSADNKWDKEAVAEYQSCISHIQPKLEKAGLFIVNPPEGSFYILVNGSEFINRKIPEEVRILNTVNQYVSIKDLSTKIGSVSINSDTHIAAYFLYVAGVALVPGSAFGLESTKGLLRLSCAVSKEQLDLAMERMTVAFDLLKDCPKIYRAISPLAAVKKIPDKKNIAIIGVGNIGEWVSYMIMKSVLLGELHNVGKIYYIGRNSKKLAAKIADQLHALIIQYQFSIRDSVKDIDQLFTIFQPSEDYSVLENSQYVITAFGAPMNQTIRERRDLLLANDSITKEVSAQLKKFSPLNTIIINVTNPVDVVTWRIQTLSGLPKQNVIGVSGVLDASRLAQAIHDVLNVEYSKINLETLTVCGEHGPHMVPLLSQVKVNGKPLLDQISTEKAKEIIEYTNKKGTSIMENLGKIPPHVGPAQAILIMLKAMLNGTSLQLSCSVWNEEYQVYMGTPINISHNGTMLVNRIIASQSEVGALKEAAEKIRYEMRLVCKKEEPAAQVNYVISNTFPLFFGRKDSAEYSQFNANNERKNIINSRL